MNIKAICQRTGEAGEYRVLYIHSRLINKLKTSSTQEKLPEGGDRIKLFQNKTGNAVTKTMTF